MKINKSIYYLDIEGLKGDLSEKKNRNNNRSNISNTNFSIWNFIFSRFRQNVKERASAI